MCFAANVSIVDASEDMTVNYSSVLELFCLVQGSHTVEVVWTNNDGSVETGALLQVNDTFYRSTLTFQSVVVEDAGNYSCEARNQIPSKSDFSASAIQTINIFVQSELATAWVSVCSDELVVCGGLS